MDVGHAERFGLRLDHALVEDFRLGQFVLEEALVVIPRALRRTFRQAREIFRIGDGFFAASLATSVNSAKSRRSIGLLPS